MQRGRAGARDAVDEIEVGVHLVLDFRGNFPIVDEALRQLREGAEALGRQRGFLGSEIVQVRAGLRGPLEGLVRARGGLGRRELEGRKEAHAPARAVEVIPGRLIGPG